MRHLLTESQLLLMFKTLLFKCIIYVTLNLSYWIVKPFNLSIDTDPLF